MPPLEAAALATPDRAYNLCEHIPKLPLLVLLAEPTPSLSVFSLLGLLLAAPLLIQALGTRLRRFGVGSLSGLWLDSAGAPGQAEY